MKLFKDLSTSEYLNYRMSQRRVYPNLWTPKFILILTFVNAAVMLMNAFCLLKYDLQVNSKQEIIREIIRSAPCAQLEKTETVNIKSKQNENGISKVKVKYLDGVKSETETEDGNVLPLCTDSANGTQKDCEIPFSRFSYPAEVNMTALVSEFKSTGITREKIINRYHHTTILRPTLPCGRHSSNRKQSNTEILFLVKTSPRNFERRNIIRQTWGNQGTFQEIRVVFVAGYSPKPSIARAISIESERHGDILQYDFFDTYYNLTLKAIGCINWAATYCANDVNFVIMVDDDYFIATDFIIEHLRTFSKYKVTQVYLGGLINSPRPQRDKQDKWYIPLADYPYNLYPPVIRGGTLVMSIDFLLDMRIVIPYTKPMPFDDVYMAIIAYKLNVSPMSEDRFSFKKINPGEDKFREIFSSHGYRRSYELKHAWRCHLVLQKLGRNVTRRDCM